MKITHIGPDSQFVKFAASLFESVAPGSNEYIILSDLSRDRLRHPIDRGRTYVVPPSRLGAFQIPSKVRNTDVIIAHSMTPHAALAFAATGRRAIKVWSGWGYDYYGSDESSDEGLLGPLTLELATKLTAAHPRTKSRVTRKLASNLIHAAAAKSDYFSAIPEDLSIFTSRFPEFKGSYTQLNYVDVATAFAPGSDSAWSNDIMVGNSASYTNNHLEAFEALARVGTGDRRIVVPLSYGQPAYRKAVIARGTQLFGSSFAPLVELLPLNEYLSTIADCGIVLMNHKRQQAVGNIGAALYRGAHVFLDGSNPMTDFLKSRGAIFGTTSDLESRGLPKAHLPQCAVAMNRRMLDSFWGAEQVTKNVENLVARLKSDTNSKAEPESR